MLRSDFSPDPAERLWFNAQERRNVFQRDVPDDFRLFFQEFQIACSAESVIMSLDLASL